jgi:hypothetical protein
MHARICTATADPVAAYSTHPPHGHVRVDPRGTVSALSCVESVTIVNKATDAQ